MGSSFVYGLIFVLTVLQCVYPSLMMERNYTHSIFMDYDKNYKLSWKFNNTEIIFETIVNTTGYVGFGFSPDGSLAKSDIVIGEVKNGNASLTDYHGFANGTLVEDNVQNWILLSAVEKNNQTKFIFKRNLITNDPFDMDITSNTMRLIWMYSDKEFNRKNVTLGGHRSMYLLQIQRPEIPIPDDAVRILVTPNATVIPNDTTTYWCVHKRVPTFKKKMHVIKISPIITKGNEFAVHHVLLYFCKEKHMKIQEEVEGLCYAANMPDTWETCNQILSGWAIGGSDFPMPAHTGFPIENSNETYMFNLEIHYDNPERASGIIDSSGMELILVPANRDFDAGTIILGYDPTFPTSPNTQRIPPFQPQFTYQGICLSSCLYDTYPPIYNNTVINVFAVLLHSHLLGRKIAVYHYRNGEKIGTIAADDNYDFNYQELVLLNQELQILPGDDIKVECTYNSMSETGFTYGGLGTAEEMCVAFFTYYPRIRVSGCLSSVILHDEFLLNDSHNPNNFEKFKNTEISQNFEEAVNGLGDKSDFLTSCSAGNKNIIEKKNTSEFLNVLRFRLPQPTEAPTTESSKAGFNTMKVSCFFLTKVYLASILVYVLMI